MKIKLISSNCFWKTISICAHFWQADVYSSCITRFDLNPYWFSWFSTVWSPFIQFKIIKSFKPDGNSRRSPLLVMLLKNTSKAHLYDYYQTSAFTCGFNDIGKVLQQLADDLYVPAFRKPPYSCLTDIQKFLDETVRSFSNRILDLDEIFPDWTKNRIGSEKPVGFDPARKNFVTKSKRQLYLFVFFFQGWFWQGLAFCNG